MARIKIITSGAFGTTIVIVVLDPVSHSLLLFLLITTSVISMVCG